MDWRNIACFLNPAVVDVQRRPVRHLHVKTHARVRRKNTSVLNNGRHRCTHGRASVRRAHTNKLPSMMSVPYTFMSLNQCLVAGIQVGRFAARDGPIARSGWRQGCYARLHRQGHLHEHDGHQQQGVSAHEVPPYRRRPWRQTPLSILLLCLAAFISCLRRYSLVRQPPASFALDDGAQVRPFCLPGPWCVELVQFVAVAEVRHRILVGSIKFRTAKRFPASIRRAA